MGGPAGSADEVVRLSELVAALSLGIDLGFGQPMEHVLRQCLIASRLAECVGLDEQTRADVYYTALLINVGCHSDAHEQAKWFGDDIGLKADKYAHGLRGLRSATAGLARLGSGADGLLGRVRVGLEFAVSGRRDLGDMITQHAALARRLAADLGLSGGTLAALDASYEQWDGKGWPGRLAGREVPIAARLACLSEFIEVAHRLGGVAGAVALARRLSGSQFDPVLVDELIAGAPVIFADGDEAESWDAVIGAEPALAMRLDPDQYDQALLAIADFIDLKSPYTLGRGRAVAEIVRLAGGRLGMPEPELRTLGRAALVHGFGRLGVSNAILDKSGPLGAGERERLRMVPYLTERMLRQSPALSRLGAIAVQYGERLDGSGFPKGLAGAAISRPARILGAAVAYQSLRRAGAGRDAASAEETATILRREVRAGRLDAEAVEAVLGAAGHRSRRRHGAVAGLTPREVDVLGLLAVGLSNRQISERLVISRKTVANHVEHIYLKIEASNRAGAALFATRHGLLTD